MLESFLKLLRRERAEEIVWTADLSYWLTARKRDGVADPAWDTEEGYLKFHFDLGVMPYYYYEKFWLAQPSYDSSVQIETRVEGEHTVTHIRTPRGELVEVSQYLPLSYSTGIVKHFVESEADLDVLLDILERRTLVPACLEDYAERRELWRRYDGFPCLGLPRSPLASLAVEWAGMVNLAYLIADCPSKVEAALGVMAEQLEPIIKAVCDVAPPLVHFPDNLSSANLTGWYDRYLAPHHRHWVERLHAAGVACAVHLDGTVRGLLPKLVSSGFDAIEAVTPKPVGDLDVAEMDQLAGDRVILWGGVPGAMFAPPYTWEDMEAHVRHVLDTWRGRPFVLGVADQVPPDGNIEFCRRIADLVRSCSGR